MRSHSLRRCPVGKFGWPATCWDVELHGRHETGSAQVIREDISNMPGDTQAHNFGWQRSKRRARFFQGVSKGQGTEDAPQGGGSQVLVRVCGAEYLRTNACQDAITTGTAASDFWQRTVARARASISVVRPLRMPWTAYALRATLFALARLTGLRRFLCNRDAGRRRAPGKRGGVVLALCGRGTACCVFHAITVA